MDTSSQRMKVAAGIASSLDERITSLAKAVKAASVPLRLAEAEQRAQAIHLAAESIGAPAGRQEIMVANAEDLYLAEQNNLAAPLLDRLELTEKRLASTVEGMHEIAAQPDPFGTVEDLRQQASGFSVGRMRTPLGVVGIIYESRPAVTADAAAICIKSANGCLLRGGSEALRSNRVFVKLIRRALEQAGLPEDAVGFIDTTDRQAVAVMLGLSGLVDVLVPRGGRGLVEVVEKQAKMPVIRHLDGICHIYIHEGANTDMAVRLAVNGKTYRYGICGATESLLVDAAIAEHYLPLVASALTEKGVELRGCKRTCSLVSNAVPASAQDYNTEYLGPVLSIKVVSGIDEAIQHIGEHGSGHTDTIVTEDQTVAQRFLREVDSASVMHNVPTCFADGKEYGLGAEIGISTDKFHARGPVGTLGLTSQKFVVIGSGETRG